MQDHAICWYSTKNQHSAMNSRANFKCNRHAAILSSVSSKWRRRSRDSLWSMLTFFFIGCVFVYKFASVPREVERRGILFKRSLDNFSNSIVKANTIKEHKSWVELWSPSPLEKVLLRSPVRQRFSERLTRIAKVCRPHKNELQWPEDLQLIAAPSHNLAVCYVQKAGSTSWHKLVHKLRHTSDGTEWMNFGHMENREYTRNISTEVKLRMLKNPDATRVLCARHPFARIISGWNNKFHRNFIARAGNVMLRTMPHIIEYFGRTVPTDPDHIISFKDFVQYIADKGLSQVDVHFRSINQMCQPCKFPYNIVVKAETAPEDLWWVLSRFNGSMENFPIHAIPEYVHENGVTTTTYAIPPSGEISRTHTHMIDPRFIVDTIKQQFLKVPRETTEKLMELYKSDFELFGYTFDLATLTAGGFY